MLREEIMQHVRDLNQTAMAAFIAVGSVYTWLLTNKQAGEIRVLWFSAPLLILVGAIRSFYLRVQIVAIAAYLRKIELELLGDDSKIKGWETEKYDCKRDKVFFTVGVVIWSLIFVAAILASLFLPPSSKP